MSLKGPKPINCTRTTWQVWKPGSHGAGTSQPPQTLTLQSLTPCPPFLWLHPHSCPRGALVPCRLGRGRRSRNHGNRSNSARASDQHTCGHQCPRDVVMASGELDEHE